MATITRIDHSRSPHIEEVKRWSVNDVDQLTPKYLAETVCLMQTTQIPIPVIMAMSINQLQALRKSGLKQAQRQAMAARRRQLSMPLVPIAVPAEQPMEAVLP